MLFARLLKEDLAGQIGLLHRGADGGRAGRGIGGHLEVEILADRGLVLVDGVAVGVNDLPITGGIAHGERQRLLGATEADRADGLAGDPSSRRAGDGDLRHLLVRVQRGTGVLGASEVAIEVSHSLCSFRRGSRCRPTVTNELVHLVKFAAVHVVEQGEPGG